MGLINDKIYIFNSEGKIIFKNNTKIVSDQSPKYYTLACKDIQTQEIIYYLIGYFDNLVQLNLLYYKYDSNLNKTILLSSKTYSQFELYKNSRNYYYPFQKRGLSCEYLYDNDYKEYYFTCFFVITYSTTEEILISGFYSMSSGSIEKIYSGNYDFLNYNGIKFIKTVANFNKTLSLVCFVLENRFAKCSIFDSYSSNFIGEVTTLSKTCRSEIYGANIGFIYSNHYLYFSCCSDYSGGIQVKIYNSDLNQFTTYERF